MGLKNDSSLTTSLPVTMQENMDEMLLPVMTSGVITTRIKL